LRAETGKRHLGGSAGGIRLGRNGAFAPEENPRPNRVGRLQSDSRSSSGIRGPLQRQRTAVATTDSLRAPFLHYLRAPASLREELVCGKQASSRLRKRRAPTEWGGYNPIRGDSLYSRSPSKRQRTAVATRRGCRVFRMTTLRSPEPRRGRGRFWRGGSRC
jgi:hypothetical protein